MHTQSEQRSLHMYYYVLNSAHELASVDCMCHWNLQRVTSNIHNSNANETHIYANLMSWIVIQLPYFSWTKKLVVFDVSPPFTVSLVHLLSFHTQFFFRVYFFLLQFQWTSSIAHCERRILFLQQLFLVFRRNENALSLSFVVDAKVERMLIYSIGSKLKRMASLFLFLQTHKSQYQRTESVLGRKKNNAPHTDANVTRFTRNR